MNDEIKFFEQRNEILFVLSASQIYIKKPLTRIQIQKIIYLSNSLSLLKDFILDYFDFKVWYNGPFSKQIQNTLNNLVGQRYINMVEYKNDQNEKAKYTILDDGERVVAELLNITTKKEDYEWITSIIRLVSYYGIKNLVDIVYAEPTFKELKSSTKNFGAKIDIYNENKNSIFKLAKEFKQIANEGFGYKLDRPGDILLAIFDYLYSEIQ